VIKNELGGGGKGHVWGTGYLQYLHTSLCWGDQIERDHLENLGVDGRIILKMGLQEVRWRGTDWIALLQDRDRWRALVNAGIS